ncbi:hypothetical protein [Kaistella sp.]|uniref:hypothetical protein n=1 Tax=Kaistella sp. TaxID=2782235 RepID=UPI003C3F7E91
MKVEFANESLAIFILVMNIYFLYGSFNIIKTEGGPMGIALIGLPVFLFINLFIISATCTLFKKFESNKFLLFLNIIGTFGICLMIHLFTS